MRRHRLEHDLAGPLRVVRFLQKFIQQVNAHVQEITVGVANVNVDLVRDLRTERRPARLENVAEVVVFLPIRSDLLVDLAGGLVPDALWIPVGTDGTIRRFPDVPLPGRS